MITAILLTCQRPNNLYTITTELQPVIECGLNEVIVWDNSPGEFIPEVHINDNLRSQIDNFITIHSKKNLYTYGRYQAMQLASNKTVITQDDDVHDINWKYLIHCYQSQPERLHCFLDESHIKWGKQHYNHVIDHVNSEHTTTLYETLLGWGSIFDPVSMLWALDLYESVRGRDRLFYQKADRIATILSSAYRSHGEPHQIQTQIQHMEGATRRDALYKHQDHWKLNQRAAEACKQVFQDYLHT
jgi:hypothetical protein